MADQEGEPAMVVARLEELELMEGCLPAVPEFVFRRRQDDPAGEEMTVPVASGQLKLALAWVGEG